MNNYHTPQKLPSSSENQPADSPDATTAPPCSLPSSLEFITMPKTSHYPDQLFTKLPQFGARWQFPSDHLPVAATIEELRIGTFNVLNSCWTHYFDSNDQGLSGSLITTANIPISPDRLWTQRDRHVVEVMLPLIESLDVLAVQECSAQLLQELEECLSSNYQILSASSSNAQNFSVLILDKQRIKLDSSSSTIDARAYFSRPECTIMDARLIHSSGRRFQVFHSHVPGSPAIPGAKEFGEFLLENWDSTACQIALGDMNFPFVTLQGIFSRLGLPEARRVVKGNTSIGSYGKQPVGKDLDHILVFDESLICSALDLGEISKQVKDAFILLNS